MSRTAICSTCRAPSGLCRCSESGRVLSAEEIARIPASRSERFVMWPDRDHGGIQVADVLTTLAHRTAEIMALRAEVARLRAVLETSPEEIARVAANFQTRPWDLLHADHIKVGAAILAYLKRKAGVTP